MKRLILFGALEDLLLAKIGVARRGGDIATFGTAWRDSGQETPTEPVRASTAPGSQSAPSSHLPEVKTSTHNVVTNPHK